MIKEAVYYYIRKSDRTITPGVVKSRLVWYGSVVVSENSADGVSDCGRSFTTNEEFVENRLNTYYHIKIEHDKFRLISIYKKCEKN